MSFWRLKIWDTKQVWLNKLNLIILLWVKFLIRGLDKDDLKEGLSKISKNIESKGEELLKAIKGKTDI